MLVAAAVIPPFIDWTEYRGRFEEQSSQLVGRPVSVDGQTSVRLLPFPSITFHDVTVTDDEGEPIFVAETFSMDAELGPLLSGEFRIFDMRMDSPLLLLTAQRDGRIDWPFRLRIPEGLRQVSVENLSITDGAIFIARGNGRSEVKIDQVDADLSAGSLGGPWQASGEANAGALGPLAFTLSTGGQRGDGSVGLSARLTPQNYPVALAIDGALHPENGRPRLDGAFRFAFGTSDEGDNAAPAVVRVKGTLKATPNRLVSDELRFETGPVDEPYAAKGSGRLDLTGAPTFAINLEGDTLGGSLSADQGARDAIRGSIDESGAGTAHPPAVSMTEIRDRILALFAELPAPAIDGQIDLKLPAIIDGETTIRNVVLAARAKEGRWEVDRLAADLPGRTTFEASGLLRTGNDPGFDGHIVLAVRQPGNFLGWLGAQRYKSLATLSSAGIEADVALGRAKTDFSNLEIVIGSSRLRGTMERQEGPDAGNTFAARLTTDGIGQTAIDLLLGLVTDRLRAESGPAVALTLSGGPFVYSGLSADDGIVRLNVSDGVAEIEELRLDGLAGSSVSATGTMAAEQGETPSLSLDMTVLSDDLADLATALRKVPKIGWLAALVERRLANAPTLGRDARVDLDMAGQPNGVLDVTVDGESSAATLSGKAVLTTGDETAAIKSGSLSLRADGLRPTLAALGFDVLPLDFDGRYAVDASVDEQGTFAAQLQGEEIVGKAKLSSGDASVIAGAVSLMANDVQPITQLLGWAPPTNALALPFELSGEVRRSGRIYEFTQLSGSVGESSYSGTVSVDTGEAIPRVEGDLKTERLDLGPLVGRLTGGSLPKSLSVDPDEGGDEGLPLAGRESGGDSSAVAQSFGRESFGIPQPLPFHGQLRVKSSAISLGRLVAQNGSLTIEAESERMALRHFSALQDGSPISGAATFTRSGASLLTDVTANVSDVDLQPLSGGYLEGSVDLAAQLTGGGENPVQLVESLSGSIRVSPVDEQRMAVQGIATDILGQVLQRADRAEIEKGEGDAAIDPTASIGPAVDLARSMIGNGEAVELPIEASVWTVANGIVRSPRLTWPVPGGRLSGTVAYAIARDRVDADLRLILDPIGEAGIGSLKPTIDISLSGSPGRIAATIDTTLLEQYLTLRAVEREQARLEALEKRIAEEAAKRKAEAEERRLQQEEEAHRRALAEAKQKAEEEARRRAEEEARRKAEEEARRLQEQAAQRRVEEEAARRRVEDQAKRKAQDEKNRLDAEPSGQDVAPQPSADVQGEMKSAPDDETRAGDESPQSLDGEERLQLEGLVPDLIPDG